MKIINAHLHLIELDKVLPDQEKYLGLLQSIPSFKNLDETLALISPESVLKQMEEAGITTSVLFACYAPLLYASNEFVSRMCEQHRDQFIGFASVDPRDKNAPQVLEHAVNVLGLRGLKLHPPLQDFYANDHAVWPIYETAAALNIPVVFHVGSTPFGHMVKLSQANPLLIDEVAVAFPKLNIILTHLGTLWHNETFMVVEKNPNVYLDTAAYPYEIKELLTMKLIERLGEDKLIFGTDFPMPYERKTHRMKDYVCCINSLALPLDIKEKIFSKNLESLLRAK
ncbi:MAG: amidohydrolase [Candidatus Omnitrophica bacterium]|nr:amidohydrolase [Candidatus Omnitrophota bacterium]